MKRTFSAVALAIAVVALVPTACTTILGPLAVGESAGSGGSGGERGASSSSSSSSASSSSSSTGASSSSSSSSSAASGSGGAGGGCTAPQQLCAGKCTDTSADPVNCGACGVTCATGDVCSAKQCRLVCGHPGFPGAPVPTVSGAIAAAVGDFDGDGKSDLAVANSNGVSVLLNQGSGRFAPEVVYQVAGGAKSIAVGDFNHDGKPDLVIATGSNVGVLFNSGNGTFGLPGTYSAGGAAGWVAVGDFDGDGRPDVAVTTSNGVSVLLNNSAVATATPYATGSGASSVVAADFNGDGKLDLAVSNYGASNVSVLLNQGNGTFANAPSSPYAIGGGPSSVAAGDFDGDGKPDIAVANLDGQSIDVLLNKGTGAGTFSLKSMYALSHYYPLVMTVGDFSGDGKADIAVASQSDPSFNNVGRVSVLVNQGNSTFLESSSYSVDDNANFVTAGDFNGDGKLDLAILDTPLSVLFNQGSGFFSAHTSAGFATVGDVNGDGKPDFVVTQPSGVDVVLNQGAAGFAAPVSYPTSAGPGKVVVGDFDGDGKPDLAITHFASNAVGVLLDKGGGTLGVEVISTANYPAGSDAVTSMAAGDFDGDGKLDLVVADHNLTVGAGWVGVLLNKGSGTFAPQVTYPVGDTPSSVVVGDLNGDGKPDLAVATTYGAALDVLINNGDGTFTARPSFSDGFRLCSVAAGDFNDDGKLDLVIADCSTQGVGGHDTLSVLLNQGGGTFAAPVAYKTGFTPDSVMPGDFDGDGRLDLVVTIGSGTTLDVLLNQGSGTFAAPLVYETGLVTQSIAVADFNGDGKPDLAVAGLNGSNLLLNQCLP